VINIWIEKRFVEASGATPKSITLSGGTGKDHEAFFCANCGTYVWSRYAVAPGGEALFVRTGTLDNPAAVKPDVHLFTRSKLPWIKLPEDAIAFETAYKIDDVWPAASKERARLNLAARV
jgi:hypothetical protein